MALGGVHLMAAYLQENPPASPQFRCPRRERPSGVVCVHTAENTPDYVAFDGGAEAVAGFISRRSDPGSYHDLVDSDSIVNLVPYHCEAYHDGTGSNRHSYGVSAATRADVWLFAPVEWRNACVRNMARAAANYAAWLTAEYGIVIPARRITRSESEARMPGFISHAERDPVNRSDPGAGFPWDQFLAEFAHLTSQGSVVEDDMPPAPDSCIDSTGRLWTVTRGVNRAVWAKVEDGDWFSLDGEALSGPSIAARPDGGLSVTVVGRDNAVWRRDADATGSWTDWFSIGGQVA